MEERLHALENEVAEVSKSVAVVRDRQRRMHQDFVGLTAALNANTEQITTLNQFVANKKGFAAGAITVVTIFGGAVGAVVWTVLEWFTK